MAPSEYWHIYACPFAVRIDLPDFIPSFNAQTLTLGKIFFTVRTARHWNRLPSDTVDALSLWIFKIHLDNALTNGLWLLISPDVLRWLDSMIFKDPYQPNYSKTPDFSLLRNQRNHPAKYASKNFVCCPVATCVDKSLLFFSAIPC